MPLQHYHLIKNFFDCYGLSHARTTLNKMIHTADAEKTWQGSSPSDALLFAEYLEKLIEATFSIIGWYDQKPAAIISGKKQEQLWSLTDYKWYCGWHVCFTPWDFFPRYLSKKEFINPYKALQKFTKVQSIEKWKDSVKNYLHYALSTASIAEYHDDTGILLTSLHLNKLVEACHLIELRTNSRKTQLIKKKKNK